MTKDLIGSQVLDHMQWQAAADGEARPAATAVVFLEPARRLISRLTWRRRAHLARRAPDVRVAVLPVVGRWSLEANARVLSYAIRVLIGSRPVVFHCRGETSALWAAAIRPHLPHSGSVVDVRGAWPEEMLFARGFDGPASADAEALSLYEQSREQLRRVLADSGAILTVSDKLAEWLTPFTECHAPITVVPCCVSACVYDDGKRQAARQRLGLGDNFVLAYLGTLTGYQHVTDGALAFVDHALRSNGAVHLLGLTDEPDKFRDAARAAGIPADHLTVLRLAQEDVPSYLMAADAGLLLRDASRMNRVSMPVKLGEYLSCGVPVIVSRMDGWVDELVGAVGAGVAIEWFGLSDQARASTAARVLAELCARGARMRGNAVSLCQERFIWPRYTESVRAAYARSLRTGT
jgi:glycosyltransferase involved in cell wall biosynthesis